MNPIAAFLAVLLAGTVFSQEEAPAPPIQPPAERAGNWTPVAIDGAEHVSADSIAKFYAFNPPTREGDKVTLENKNVKTVLTLGSDEVLINGIKFKCTSKVLLHEGQAMVSRMDLSKLLDPVLRPGDIQAGNREFRTVVLDPVLGGETPGQENNLGTEAGFAFQIAGKIKTDLETRGFKVELTRSQDENPSIAGRLERIGTFDHDAIVISLGFSSDAAAPGIRTRVIAPLGVPGIEGPLQEEDKAAVPGNASEDLSIALATAMHSCVVNKLGRNTSDLGIVRSRLPLLEQLGAPAIFIECGSIAHPYEARLIANETYQTAVASGIVNGVDRYRKAIGQK
ncbi:N-acetylmuramoyl-L-alanine amidase [Luteolibacter sp. Populi]|uniref:N-acetylmuramoyl-L-alanine amidase family protein n=1 Tax=Luteolibacter sp. Populi TaxID=3230487 RepID=UPI00346684DE